MRDPAADLLKASAVVLRPGSFADSLVELIGDADIVLIGEATHGTHEFYRLRADLTQALVESHGFNVIAADVGWSDAWRVNRWVRLAAEDLTAQDALGGIGAFPRWTWMNHDVVRFVDWLRARNAGTAIHARAGFYGLDTYDLRHSLATLLRQLARTDAGAAQRARERYGCIDVSGRDSQSDGFTVALGLTRAVEHDLVARLAENARTAAPAPSGDLHGAAEDHLALEQHARCLREAEPYYRAMFGSSSQWWNLRDAQMLVTLEAVLGHVVRAAGRSRAVVWAHNAHAGDTRALRGRVNGEVSIGQLARERFGSRVCSVGFTTHAGSITAACGWDQPTVAMALRPSRRDSYEHLFHEIGSACIAVDLRGRAADVLAEPRLTRMIGAVYRPESERWSHYSQVSLPLQFDIVVHCDASTAVEPLELWSRREVDVPETSTAGV